MNRRHLNKLVIFLAVACILMAVSLVALAFCFRSRQNLYGSVKEQWEKKEKEYIKRLEALEEQDGSDQGEESQGSGQEDPEAEDLPAGKSEASAADVWESLDGAKPGYVVSPENLDMENLSKYFNEYSIAEGDEVYQRINGKSYRDNSDIGLADLSYLLMLHYDYEGQIRVGEMIVNKAVAADVRAIFQELFENQYQIQSMYLVDNYWGEGMDGIAADSASIDQNNTSAFNYRIATDSTVLSNHAYGRAIDLNPLQNPYVMFDEAGNPYSWYDTMYNDYLARARGHEIDHDDLACQVFLNHGFTWGGDWSNPVDYQHFEKKQ